MPGWHLAWRTTTARKARTHRKLLFYPRHPAVYNISYFKRETTNGQNRFSVFGPAQEAFDLALEKFKQTSEKKWEKRRLILEATTLRDIVDVVAAAQNRYVNEHTKSQTRTCITELSKRVCYYGKVMDVLVQHHPEYVSLAWGAMKLVFGVGTHSLSRQVATIHNMPTRLLSNMRTWAGPSSQVYVMSRTLFHESR